MLDIVLTSIFHLQTRVAKHALLIENKLYELVNFQHGRFELPEGQ